MSRLHPSEFFRLSPLSVALFAVLATSSAGAQQYPSGADTATMGEVRIYGTTEKDIGFAPKEAETAGKAPGRILDTPQSVSVVTREEMESRQVTNLQQALQTVAGVNPVNFGRRGFDDVFMRGFRTTESILIDGLVQSPGMWTRLQSYGYERYEVLKGANSVMYGQMQPGGLINAISKRPKRDEMGEVQLDIGSFGLRSLAADYNKPLSENGKTALRINAIAANTDDPTHHVWRRDRWVAPSLSLDFGPNTDFVVFGTYNNGQWMRQQGTSPYGTLLPNVNGSVDRRMFTGDPSFGGYDIDQYTLGYSLQHRFANGFTLRQNVRYEEEKGTGNFVSLQALGDDQRTQNRQATRQWMDYDLIATDTSMLMPFEAMGMRHQVVAGIDARTGHSLQKNIRCRIGALDLFAPVYGMTATCPSTYRANSPSKLTTVGVYAQDQIKFGAQWTLVAGLRHERARTFTDNQVAGTQSTQRDNDTTGNLGLVYEFRPNWSTYASYSESFLPVSGQDAAGNMFKPETGKQLEWGVKYAGKGRTASLAVYDLKRRNVSVSDPVNEGFNIQAGEQRARGIELEGGLDLRGGWKLTAAYAYTDAEITEHTDASMLSKPVDMSPLHSAVLWADWRLPRWQAINLGFGARYVGTAEAADIPYKLPAYTAVDASASYTGDNYRITLGIKNLFDKDYYDGAINEYVVSPGMPRAYYLTVKYLF